jgi:mono/diheme cytochrome c family protein
MNIQTKILLGISSFVGMMLLVGWIAINEPARMEVFTQQWEGRSVERGAELYYNNCTTCHGVDGKGLAGIAPALNNPMLFLGANPGKAANDRLLELNASKTAIEKTISDHAANLTARTETATKLAAAAPGSEDAKNLQAELDRLDGAIQAFDPAAPQRLEQANADIATQQAEVDALRAQGWEVNRAIRLVEVKWPGGLRDYLTATLNGGRPTSALYWPRPMAAWAQSAGGPLRPDEIDNLVNFLLNYEASAVQLTPNDVNQQFKNPVDAANVPQSDKVVVGLNADIRALNLTGGDAVAGQQKYTQYACAGCHSAASGAAYAVAPTAGTWTRVVNVRLRAIGVANADLADLTPEQYLAHSILYPNEYIIPNAAAGVMPQNFGEQLDEKDLQDLIAYLETQK